MELRKNILENVNDIYDKCHTDSQKDVTEFS